jgi:hypothetical protein
VDLGDQDPDRLAQRLHLGGIGGIAGGIEVLVGVAHSQLDLQDAGTCGANTLRSSACA